MEGEFIFKITIVILLHPREIRVNFCKQRCALKLFKTNACKGRPAAKEPIWIRVSL